MMKNDNKIHNGYSYISTILEVAVLAALGHFGIAACFFGALMLSMGLKSGWRQEGV